MLNEFRSFAIKGNVIDMAVGIIIGGAFGKIVSSLVADVIMPPIGLMLGKVDFSNLYVDLSGGAFVSLAEAKAAGAATINYGVFANTILNFVIVAFSIFLVIRYMNRLREQPAPASPTEKDCPHCLMKVPIAAKRCGHCTSQIETS